jgi:AraC-like DNA-binding protein
MDDNFASAGMLRLLLRAMAAEGLTPPLPLPEGARVPLAHKQQVVTAIVRTGGLALLLRLAQQVQHIAGEPLHLALSGARDPHDFLARWLRLERHVHASHRVLPRERGVQSLRLEHAACDSTAPPQGAESVAVLGVWIGALAAIGTAELAVEVGGCPVHGPGSTGDWPSPAQLVGSSGQHWRLHWSACAPSPRPRPIDRLDGPHPFADPALTDLPWPEPAASVARWLLRDPAGHPRVADAAAALGLPPRTLQRRLAEAGSGFGEVLGEVRVRLAAAWLVEREATLAEIGFRCGYADQPHFTREFTRRAGLSPARYRTAAAPRP